MITADTAGRIARLTLANGGATVDPTDGTLPLTGYAVALPGLEQTYPVTSDPDTLAAQLTAYADAHAADLASDSRYLGTWVDFRSAWTEGTLYVDTVEIYTDRDAAELAGLAAGQLAIFDLAAGEEIRLTAREVTP